MDAGTGERRWDSEVSSIDTALLLGVLTAKQFAQILRSCGSLRRFMSASIFNECRTDILRSYLTDGNQRVAFSSRRGTQEFPGYSEDI
jgi:hypothetical protein